ncbi:MAG: hypothetical protein ACT4N2_08400 [Hyphomicrobium sp.]
MTHHHTTRTALDIRERIETIQDRARRAEDQHAEIVADMQATVDLIRR